MPNKPKLSAEKVKELAEILMATDISTKFSSAEGALKKSKKKSVKQADELYSLETQKSDDSRIKVMLGDSYNSKYFETVEKAQAHRDKCLNK